MDHRAGRSRMMYVITALHGGGAERLLRNILVKQSPNQDISVVSLLPGGVFRSAIEKIGVAVTDLAVRRYRHACRAVFVLAARIRTEKPQVVCGWMYHGNLLASVAVFLSGRWRTKLFWGIFCSDIPHEELTVPRRLVRFLNAMLSRWTDGIIYNAEAARDFHRSMGFTEPQAVIISNCSDPDEFRHDPQHRVEVRRELGIDDDAVVIAVVARVDAMKDWTTVREAVRGLGVVTIGVGKGTEQLPPQAGFIALGWRDDMPRILSAVDIFLLGSAFGEGTSLALTEAMLCGLPCVVTSVGDNHVVAGNAGVVVEPRNPFAIREAVLQLAHDRERRARLGRAARERAEAVLPHESVQIIANLGLSRNAS